MISVTLYASSLRLKKASCLEPQASGFEAYYLILKNEKAVCGPGIDLSFFFFHPFL
jgi:hypothetical protein